MFLLFAFVFIIVVISSACLKLNENLSTLVTNLFLSINFCSLYCYLLTESALYIGSCISYMLLPRRSYFYAIARYCPNSFSSDRSICLDGILCVYLYIDEKLCVNIIIKSYMLLRWLPKFS